MNNSMCLVIMYINIMLGAFEHFGGYWRGINVLVLVLLVFIAHTWSSNQTSGGNIMTSYQIQSTILGNGLLLLI